MDENKKRKVIISEDEITEKIKEVGKRVSQDYEGRDILVVSLLKGSFIFTADLVRQINVPTQVEFMTTSSYGHNEESAGEVDILNDLDVDVRGRDILIVDDIMDTGLTMKKIIEHLESKGPNSVRTCVLLDKPERRKVDITPSYVGFTIPDLFIVGYGLNYGDYYRGVPYIFSFQE
ncbi:bifunctional protein TilS/HprT [Gottschalkia purinilytica]|uniref:Hypoxanthine phosphoribosyltransferase n=1 Tax=Gottschalkia purinilytica TaxID=1503 RepID=A0A0L0W7Q7_GOTPU|nr:hypoxanthine phosphoribosyltransferase [Gottschalkia purinilytica]KNF07462.1 bifunctional protein TilS/HprT [Gottschalkia purinilytica]